MELAIGQSYGQHRKRDPCKRGIKRDLEAQVGDSFGAPQELLCLVGSACILYMYCVVYISYIVTAYLLKYGVHKYSMPM